MTQRTAAIIGAGPAGLTAALELLKKTDIRPIVLEMTSDIGGISKTLNYKGNRIDLGGHRFFSRSDRVMEYWRNIFPIQGKPARDDLIIGRLEGFSDDPAAPDPEKTDEVLLTRSRVSRIFFMRKFFDYPLAMNAKTMANLGLLRMFKMAFSYIKACMFPIKNERTLEDFIINRFGKELYLTFFKDYTEKVWGASCDRITAEWGAQRIKGLSIKGAIAHAFKSIFRKDTSIEQKQTETTLITQFLYPKFGPGQMWEQIARIIESRGGKVLMRHQAVGLRTQDSRIVAVQAKNLATGEVKSFNADYVFSTMPVKDLISAMGDTVPENIRQVSEGLVYRDFVTVGLLLKKLKIKNETNIKTVNGIVPDNWIYIQERDVKIGRLQIFNNWSPYMVEDPETVWIGLEYFCTEGDCLWSKPDDEFIKFAISELAKIDIIDQADVLDSVLIRMPKTYPAYFGTYDRFVVIRNYVDKFDNLFLVGRNGMHKYNNQDHSMLTAMTAVDNIVNNIKSKDNIWAVNTEQEYHEEN